MIKVIKSGFYSSLQDLGRFGFQEFGVPVSGVMDAYSAKLANLILGNNAGDAVLEMTMTGPVLEFQTSTLISISGANMKPRLNDSEIRMNTVISANTNDILSFGKLSKGIRCYLAVAGGFQTEEIMGSRSMYRRITHQNSIKTQDLLNIADYNPYETSKNASIKISSEHFESKRIDVFEGPEFDRLNSRQKSSLFESEFTVSKENNRMAYQLEEGIKNQLDPIITSCVLPGTIQLTPSGKLIILMRDAQTTGGYPRILQLTESALNILSQKYTGDTFKFNLIPYN